jgi:hypothetical protein
MLRDLLARDFDDGERLLTVLTASVAGRLAIGLRYDRELFSEAIVGQIATRFTSCIQELTEQCASARTQSADERSLAVQE